MKGLFSHCSLCVYACARLEAVVKIIKNGKFFKTVPGMGVRHEGARGEGGERQIKQTLCSFRHQSRQKPAAHLAGGTRLWRALVRSLCAAYILGHGTPAVAARVIAPESAMTGTQENRLSKLSLTFKGTGRVIKNHTHNNNKNPQRKPSWRRVKGSPTSGGHLPQQCLKAGGPQSSRDFKKRRTI